MSLGDLYGSPASPYVRLCRLVAAKAGAEIRFVRTDPFDAAFRRTNPLGRVPALALTDGPLLADSGLICRYLMGEGRDLLPEEPSLRLRHEAAATILIGALDLGVAYLMEARRETDISAKWQERRLEGIARTLPYIEEAASLAEKDQTGYLALTLCAACDWLSFRLAEKAPWQDHAPRAAALMNAMASDKDVQRTDPRLG